ncbi:DUF4330 family protein [Halobiforma nitratireducens]|uniref:DUF4330 domain-containing protein n=1 Tax=Halobiforma nitratireducens JCM 10879 TaxID=1227454 RepID=M0MN99_9EURY|nr:DUF4330 family protein [Halobiforma nitratireducens]EMA47126.1 hypothetical protein C446_00385 [Halobiforma nitratireducens JCM 10879]
MELIDEDGNLFGVVNVIDALVVLLLLAVVVAGVALVTGGEPNETATEDGETGYATVELGQQPDYVIDRLRTGNTAVLEGTGETVTVTDVYVTPLAAGETNETVADGERSAEANNETTRTIDAVADSVVQPHVVVRLEFENVGVGGDESREEFHVDGDPLLLGDERQLDMGTYRTNGTVTDLSFEDPSLGIEESTTTAEVELRNVSPGVAGALEEGMTETVRGNTHARIDAVEEEPASVVLVSDDGNIHEREHPRNRDVTLTVELRTQESTSTARFRGEPVRIGSSIVLDFDTLVVEGDVVGVE